MLPENQSSATLPAAMVSTNSTALLWLVSGRRGCLWCHRLAFVIADAQANFLIVLCVTGALIVGFAQP